MIYTDKKGIKHNENDYFDFLKSPCLSCAMCSSFPKEGVLACKKYSSGIPESIWKTSKSVCSYFEESKVINSDDIELIEDEI